MNKPGYTWVASQHDGGNNFQIWILPDPFSSSIKLLFLLKFPATAVWCLRISIILK